MGSYCYTPSLIRITLTKICTRNWRWRLLDHFSAQLAEGHGCRTKDIARKVAKQARAQLHQNRLADRAIHHTRE